MPVVLRANLKVVTPLFLGGADPDNPELRASSIKSALRQWYRAIAPEAVFAAEAGGPRNEDRIFGGSAERAGQSPIFLRVLTPAHVPEFDWSRVTLDRYNEGGGRQVRNGLRYLSYPFHLRGNDGRRAVDAGAEFTLVLLAPKKHDSLSLEIRRAWIASLWLLGAAGSLGSRSRRGFGSIEITNWASIAEASDWAEDAAALPDLSNPKNGAEWQARFQRGKESARAWFGSFQKYDKYRFEHPHFGAEAAYRLLGGFGDWPGALNAAGRRMQDFRVRRQPDYDNVKRALESGKPLVHTPERAVFGLPLTFRFSSLSDAGTAKFLPTDPERRKHLDRHASLLRVRLVRIGSRVHPLFLRMSGAMPGQDPGADLIRRQRGRGETENLAAASGTLLDQFMSELARG
jgi:CRISPR-associated protein Cmr1